MTALKRRVKQMLSMVLMVLALVACILLAGVSSGQAINSALTSKTQLPSQKSSGPNLGTDRETTLRQLYSQLKSGAAFTAEEADILTRFANGTAISEIEADIVISRVLYARSAQGKALSPEQIELLLRYKEFIAGGAKASGPVVSSACATCGNYTVNQATGAAIVAGTTDAGNHCDDCTTPITLPFPYTLYDQTFTTARVGSNGNLQFASSSINLGGCLPQSGFSYTIFAYYTDLFTFDAASGQGVFTSVSGAAPNRIFNIEWRTQFCCSSGPPLQDFEIRLYEGQQRFDIIYGQLDSSFVAVGVQRDTDCFTQYECNASNTLSPGLQLTFTGTPSNLLPSYTVNQATGAAIVAGTTDAGNHCDDCTTPITLPFPYTLYDQTFTTARVGSNGNLQFASSNNSLGGCVPQFGFSYTIFAYYADLLTSDAASGKGVFTSVSGAAPNRIFNIEWRTRFCCSSGPPLQDFEIRLYEGQQRFDIIYGQLDSSFVAVGVQRDTDCFTQYECSNPNTLSPGLQLIFSTACTTVNCPADITVGASQCPTSGGSVVTFPAPTTIGDCGAVTCSPASGSFFPIGTTTVTCSTLSGSSCSFTITVTGNCLQDDSNPSNSVTFNPQTGNYTFCCGGATFSGTGTVTARGCGVTIQHTATDRRVLIKFDGSVNTGSASLQSPPGATRCTISDRNTTNNNCVCQ